MKLVNPKLTLPGLCIGLVFLGLQGCGGGGGQEKDPVVVDYPVA